MWVNSRPIEVPNDGYVRDMSETALQMAMRHVTAGKKIVEGQKVLIAKLRRDGHVMAVARAEDLLRTYERSLAAFERDLGEIVDAEGNGPTG